MQQLAQTAIQFIKGVGPAKSALLNKLGIFTIADIITYFPRRYEDRSQLKSIANLIDGQSETFSAIITGIKDSRPRPGLTITKVAVQDRTGLAYLIWFNQQYKKKTLKPGLKIVITGKVQKRGYQIQISNPEVEILDGSDMLHTNRIVPIYPLSENISQKFLRTLIWQLLLKHAPFREFLPQFILQKYNLMIYNSAITNMHFPDNMDILSQARQRLAFEELYIMQCGLALLKQKKQKHLKGIKHLSDSVLVQQLQQQLPFALTTDQLRALQEIKADMEEFTPMQRLLQGDVGSGKTIVAVIALAKTVENGFQGALMVPTEILAEQHYNSISSLFAPLGIQVALLTGSMASNSRTKLLQLIKEGSVNIVIGTHALIQTDVEFNKLGLVITDEQHRFGVLQRQQLQQKGDMPDVLFMTATPIPRTMALTVYGDLDVSVIRQMPPGRKPIKTYLRTTVHKQRIYKFVAEQVVLGRQAYVVCPLIEDSLKIEAQSATELYNQLAHTLLKQIPCGLVHGKMNAKQREAIVSDFYSGKIKVLFATTVIEVGVNVPNATVMVIEGADRFGLAQLHQLRGRIGRGTYQSYCILISDSQNNDTMDRLNIIAKTNDGFDLAEQDLLLRGPGQFFGTKQHGIADLKVANIILDFDLLLLARTAADETVKKADYLEIMRPFIYQWYKKNNISILHS